MDVVLSGGLNLGSYSPDCWQSIFAVCRHVSQLEHDMFSIRNASVPSSSPNANRDIETGEKLQCNGGQNEKINLASIPIDDDETW